MNAIKLIARCSVVSFDLTSLDKNPRDVPVFVVDHFGQGYFTMRRWDGASELREAMIAWIKVPSIVTIPESHAVRHAGHRTHTDRQHLRPTFPHCLPFLSEEIEE